MHQHNDFPKQFIMNKLGEKYCKLLRKNKYLS